MPKYKEKGTREHTRRCDDYHERETQIRTGNRNHVCLNCRKSFKQAKDRYDEEIPCPICNTILEKTSTAARVPRSKASNKKWQSFIDKFLPWIKWREEEGYK
mgnify:CR=1 FL=1